MWLTVRTWNITKDNIYFYSDKICKSIWFLIRTQIFCSSLLRFPKHWLTSYYLVAFVSSLRVFKGFRVEKSVGLDQIRAILYPKYNRAKYYKQTKNQREKCTSYRVKWELYFLSFYAHPHKFKNNSRLGCKHPSLFMLVPIYTVTTSLWLLLL